MVSSLNIYKFYPINDDLFKAISDSYIWFCSHKDFNDPFDCQHQVDVTASQKEIEAYLRFAYSSTGKTISRANLRQQVRDFTKHPEKLHKSINNSLERVISDQYLGCFSMIYDNLLLWSHYTEKHTGVCLCYGLPVVASNDFIPVKVEYSPDYPYLNYIKTFKDRSKLAIDTLGRKSNDWLYEQELRIVSHIHGANPVSKKALTKVILGCRSKSDEINAIIRTVRDSGLDHVEFEQAVKEEAKYALRFEPLNV